MHFKMQIRFRVVVFFSFKFVCVARNLSLQSSSSFVDRIFIFLIVFFFFNFLSCFG